MQENPSSAPPTRLRRLTRAIVAGALVGVVVTMLAFLVRQQFDPLIRADEAAIRAATSTVRGRSAVISALITWQEITQPLNGYLVASAVCLWAWLAKGLRTRAWWAFLTMMVGWSLALGLKYLVQRARPIVDEPISHSPGWSFPSGHAANAAITSIALVVLLWPLLGATARRVAVILAALYITTVALDRVFLGVHFPSDVTGGVLLGAGLVGASYLGYRGWSPQEKAVEP